MSLDIKWQLLFHGVRCARVCMKSQSCRAFQDWNSHRLTRWRCSFPAAFKAFTYLLKFRKPCQNHIISMLVLWLDCIFPFWFISSYFCSSWHIFFTFSCFCCFQLFLFSCIIICTPYTNYHSFSGLSLLFRKKEPSNTAYIHNWTSKPLESKSELWRGCSDGIPRIEELLIQLLGLTNASFNQKYNP
jgi:hypothetical protein